MLGLLLVFFHRRRWLANYVSAEFRISSEAEE